MRKYLQLLVGTSISSVFLYLVLRKVELSKFLLAFKSADYHWVAYAAIILSLHFFLRILRWKVLLWPIGQVSLSSITGTMFISFFVNNFLPARLGDVIRGFFLSKRENVPLSSSIATLIAEKFLDGLAILSSFGLLTVFFKKNHLDIASYKLLLVGTYFTLALFILTALAFYLIKYSPDTFLRFLKSSWKEKTRLYFSSFSKGLDWMGNPFQFGISLLLSYGVWVLYALGIQTLCKSFYIKVPFYVSFLTMVAICILTTLPFTPGYVGTYHAATTYCLAFYGVPMAEAAAVAFLYHGMFFVISSLPGVFFLWYYHISFRSLREVVKD